MRDHERLQEDLQLLKELSTASGQFTDDASNELSSTIIETAIQASQALTIPEGLKSFYRVLHEGFQAQFEDSEAKLRGSSRVH